MTSKLVKVFLDKLRRSVVRTDIVDMTLTLLRVLSAAVDLRSETSFSHVGTISGDRFARKSRKSWRIL
jgi:hypothetical protein